MSSQPELSVVVILYDMNDEAPQTLASLSSAYQRAIAPEQYEIIVIDNGSPAPLPRTAVEGHGPNFRYFEFPDAPPSPAAALNLGASVARGKFLGFIVDGARMSSPGLLRWARTAFDAFLNPVCTAPAFHLGPDVHRAAVEKGHTKEKEQELLASISWQQNGYRLFEISTLAPSSRQGWLGPGSESSSLFLRRSLYDALGGYDERFDAPGGGLVNQDFYSRILERNDTELVTLLGEGTFHQMHGGAATGQTAERFRVLHRAWNDQYQSLRGKSFEPSRRTPVCLGRLGDEAREVFLFSLSRA
jgi:glycosyltransferase involved in cell wall biosynthesis